MKSIFNPFGGHLQKTPDSIADLDTIDHDLLDGLADDDHTQYILVDGTRAFTGNQSFSDNNITNVDDIALNTISAGSDTSVIVILSAAAGVDNFEVGNNDALVVVGGNDRVGIGTDRPVSTLDLNGSMSAATVEKSANYTLTRSDYFVNCDASGGSFTITLPAVIGNEGRVYHVKKKDSSGNTVTVDGNSSETIDGAITAVLTTQYESIKIINDGTEWWII